MRLLGVQVPPDQDVTRIGLDSVWAVDLLTEVGRAFAARIDFEHPDGLELNSSGPH